MFSKSVKVKKRIKLSLVTEINLIKRKKGEKNVLPRQIIIQSIDTSKITQILQRSCPGK